ncbi:MAG: 4Fe-4S binding protein [Firmicutes bacterium]|nr:4Fe-4S binding protein [Bacillota bacterium]
MAKGKVEFAAEYCKGCSLCVDACPKKILRLSDRVNAKGYHVTECFNPDECIGCAFCATMCPDCVISVFKE